MGSLKHLFAAIIVFVFFTVPAIPADDCFLSKRSLEWESLFIHSLGFTTGSDGIYSIPLNGSDRRSNNLNHNTLITLGDSFIGRILPQDIRSRDSVMVNNVIAMMIGNEPSPEAISFFWGKNDRDVPTSVFLPSTSGAEKDSWYWLEDGIVINDNLHLMALRLVKTGPGDWDWQPTGVTMITGSARKPLEFSRYVQSDTPFFRARSGERGEMIFGSGILANTKAGGSPIPDGYVYIYGTETQGGTKYLLAARVLPRDFMDFKAWRFWDGNDWNPDIADCARITGRVSQELSVTPLESGCFALVFQRDGMGTEVTVQLSSTPYGPFGKMKTVWNAPEPSEGQEIYVYNAKAHPNLSLPGELLITYNVNTFNYDTLFHNADIYRPRFVRVWNLNCCEDLMPENK